MATSQIGIKIADGTFYPILDEASKEKKKLVVTTVRDNQEQVQIELYRSSAESIEQGNYIGRLTIEDIPHSPKGELEVEVVIGVDDQGNLTAVATESLSGSRQSLTTSLSDSAAPNAFTVPDFELEDDLESEVMLDAEEEDLTGTAYPVGEEDRRRAHLEKRGSPLLRVLFVILGLIVIAGLTFLLFQLLKNQSSGPAVGSRGAPEQVEQVEQTGDTAQAGTGDADSGSAGTVTAAGSADQVATAEKKTAQPGAEGVWYTIRWGDTLWDLSATYYRNPWLYPRIARHPRNSIEDPDVIIAGTRLFIPRN